MTLPAGQFEARQYMSQLQRLVADTNAILERSVGDTRKGCARARAAGACYRADRGLSSIFHFRYFFAQLRQARDIRKLLQIFFERTSRSAPHHLTLADDLGGKDSAAGTEHRPSLDASLIADPHLPADHRVSLPPPLRPIAQFAQRSPRASDSCSYARCGPGCRA